MIVRIEHPDKPGQHAFIPVRYHSESNAWLPLLDENRICETRFEAVAVCLDHVLPSWDELLHTTRILRALSEHRGFDFDSDGVTSDMVQREIRSLLERAEAMGHELPNLMREPDRDDPVEVTGLLLPVTIEVADTPV